MLLSAVLDIAGPFDDAEILRPEVTRDTAIPFLLHRLAILFIAIRFVARGPEIWGHLRAHSPGGFLVEWLVSIKDPGEFPMVPIVDRHMPVDAIAPHRARKSDEIR